MPEVISFKDRLFYEFFSPPAFLDMPAIGLSISDTAISVIELVRKKDAYAVGRFGRSILPSGAISGGYVNDKDSVVVELRRMKETMKLDFIHASLSEEKAYLFDTRIPYVQKKEIRGTLEFKLEENVPIPASEAIFDYTVIPRHISSHNNHIDVNVTVLPRKVVDTYIELITEAGLIPLSFEIEAQAVARAVVPRGDTGTYLVVNFGENKTGLFIVSNEVVHFTSTVGIGGANITAAIAKYLSVSIKEAEVVKREHAALKDRKNMDLFFSLMNAISALKDEVNKLSMYWHTHKDGAGEMGQKIQKIVLSGRDAGLSGFDDYLSLSLGLPVTVGNVWVNTFSFHEYVPPLTLGESLDYAAAIGLAMPKGH